MTSRKTTRDQAVEWLVLRDQRDLTASESQAFEEWLRHPENAAAWSEAERSWNVFSVARNVAEQDPQLEALRHAALAMRPRPSRFIPFAAAAALVLAVAAAFLWKSHSGESLQTAASTSVEQLGALANYSTEVGQRREVFLPDGTRLNLNTGTAVRVQFAPGQRVVELRQGQATFNVAKDTRRPFVVQAGDRSVRAVGTVFDVYLTPERLRVTLSEGKVTVGHLGPTSGTETSLEPGQQLVSTGSTERVATVDVTRALLWHDGMVEFNDESLGDALAEMNRYTPFPVRIRDEKIRALRLSGLFHTDRMDQFLQAVQELLPVKVRQNAGGQTEIAGLE